ICPTQLSGSLRVAWPFLCMLADRLAGASQLSEDLLVSLLSELGKQLNQVHWSYKGVRRLLARCELPVLDKLALATLIQVQEATSNPHTLSLYTEISNVIQRNLKPARANYMVAPVC
ncbi:MAG: hypothetical protein ACREQ5_38265, partial [Candidatus Dormibacteria bacterium]